MVASIIPFRQKRQVSGGFLEFNLSEGRASEECVLVEHGYVVGNYQRFDF